jgi:hypothetical protein
MAKLPFFCEDGLFLKDDFYVNDAVTDALIGELAWELVAITGAGTPIYATNADTQDGTYGVLRSITDGTANRGNVFRLFENGIMLGPKGGFFTARIRCHDVLAGNNFRFGLQDSVTATDSGVGIWVDCLAGVVTVQADSSHGDNTLTPTATTGLATLTGGTTIVLDTWHHFKVQWSGTNGQGGPKTVEAWVDGYFAGSIPCEIDNDEPMEFSMSHWDTSAGATLEWDVDYIQLFIAR